MVSSRRVDIDSLLDKAKAIIKGSAPFVSNKELARLYSIDDKPVRSSCIGQILRDRLTDTQLEKMKNAGTKANGSRESKGKRSHSIGGQPLALRHC